MTKKAKMLTVFGIGSLILLGIVTVAALVYLSEPVQTEMLMWASERGDIKTVRKHLDSGISPDIRDGWSGSPMFYAAGNCHTDLVEFLLQRGVDVNTSYRMKKTALIVAAQHGCFATVKFLIDRGADISISDQDGMTARDHAKKKGYADIVNLLD